MEVIVPTLVSLLASLLTLFSGFGLGMLLLPAFTLFFPVEIAVMMTAVVHFANNLFKLSLLGKFADKEVVLKFGLPAIVASFLGANVLSTLSTLPPVLTYQVFGTNAEVSVVKLTLAILMIVFALLEFQESEDRFAFDRKYLLLGGALSGFFGGLSGHQGALRTMFLLRCNLEKKTFLASGILIACMIDISRLLVYQHHLAWAALSENVLTLVSCILFAFLGAFLGARLVEKVTMRGVQRTVATMLILIALLLGLGVI
ncbi:MAG: hypothetical protein CMR00_01335 [[Chlorobium] sp. 445]|nr:MAG: hypothetical protein CMR00_01335 [[Chlorobium] sp. 445]